MIDDLCLDPEAKDCIKYLESLGLPVTEALLRFADQKEESEVGGRKLANAVLAHLAAAENYDVGFYGAAYPLNSPLCRVSMAEMSRKLGWKRATLSKSARIFQRANNLPKSTWMIKDESK